MVARTRHASFGQTLLWVVLPGALPQIAAGLRISLSWAYLIVIVTEMYAGPDGGLVMLDDTQILDIALRILDEQKS